MNSKKLENISDQDLKTFIQKFDLDEDGEIDYTEFVNGMSDMNKEK